MYKSLLDVFTQKQMQALRGKMWWVADSHKPYLVKYASQGDFALMELTDLRSLWVARIHNSTLLEEKGKFAKSLEIKNNKDLMHLFESLLTATDTSPHTVYSFKEVPPTELHFTFRKMIKIYDFNWTFKLKKVNCNPVELVCKQLLTPLSSALQAQASRLEKLKKRFDIVQGDYLLKLNEAEKSRYKSPLLEKEEDWSLLLPKIDGSLITLWKPDEFSQFCLQNFAKVEKSIKKEEPLPMSAHKADYRHKIPSEDNFQLLDDYLSRELQRQRQKQKKQKKIDFI